MFKHYPSNERQIRFQRHATRLYILLIVVSLVILTFYSLLIKQIASSTVSHPTEFEYSQLQQMYPHSLQCPCTSISTPYSTFITIQPQYHQVCSSDFVSSEWITYLSTSRQDIALGDFRVHARYQFELLSTLCQQTRQTIENALLIFLQTQFVSSQVLSKDFFESQADSIIEDWKSVTINRFLRTLDLIGATTQGNQLMSNHNTHFVGNAISTSIRTVFYEYSNCSCGLSPSCADNMFLSNILDGAASVSTYVISNFFIGCYPLEALLASTLECFYDLSCLLTINQYISNGEPLRFSPLNVTLNQPNDTIRSMVDRLMVDSWSPNKSFSSYYNACAPHSCTFQYQRQYDIFFVITTIISVFGGFSLAFKLIILIGLRFIEKIIDGHLRRGLKYSLKTLFSCDTEQQIIRRMHVLFVLATFIHSLCIFCLYFSVH